MFSARTPEVTGAAVSFPLVRDGKPAANVLVGGDNKDLIAAVDDLRKYVKQITGAELNIVRGTKDLPGPTLHLGETELLARVADVLPRIKLDGYAMASFGEDLLVAGAMPQGTANGIVTILQDRFGVRWYAPGPLWEIVPQRQSLSISFEPNAGGVYVENPSLLGRTLWGKPDNLEFARRMRLTLGGVQLPYTNAGHSLSRAVPTEKYAASHPDYFCSIDGKRVLDGQPHPCFTHPDMFDVFMDYVRSGGKSFGVNDNLTACQCDRCRAIDGKAKKYLGMPNFSESFCQLMARVAKQTAVEFPGRRLGIFAYQQTSAPPQTVDRLGDNVDVVLCQDTGQHFDPALQRMDFDYASQWTAKAGGVRFYGYVGISYWTPRYFPKLLAQHIQHLVRIGVKGWGTHHATMIDSSMPMSYMMYQMLWNADLDQRVSIERMLTDLYGPAVKPMRQFYEHWEQCWMRQKTGRWFWGMDNFRGEMEIYSEADIHRGRQLLDEAAALADNDTIRQRVRWIGNRYAWTEAAARAHFVSIRAIESPSPQRPEEAIALSQAVADAWQAFGEQLPKAQKLDGIVPVAFLDKTFRVRAWGLKQQMRDAALAPLVRWVVAHEEQVEPDRLAKIESQFAETALASRQTIERYITDAVAAQSRPPRADGLRVAAIPRSHGPMPVTGGPQDWPSIRQIDALKWVFRQRPDDDNLGKYDEPLPQHVVDPPRSEDQSMTWQAAWDERRLYIRLVVTDDVHVQNQPAAAMWKEDSVQIALNPVREDFVIRAASWDYLFGGYRGTELEFGMSLHDGRTDVAIWNRPKQVREADANGLIAAKAGRHGTTTAYEAAIDWALLPGFVPKPHKSVGICLVVNDVDSGARRSAEYGSGVVRAKRPTEFAAIRLADAP